ncbi:MAG: cupin domain-containing protein [Pseudomonadota bacterium]
MELNADFSARVVVHSATLDWQPSPMAGVDRRMLDRVGDEVARATTIVRYAPGSAFSPHVHGGGEEFVVLDGVFSDEHGDYPAGSYLRNPPTSQHTPGSEPGCVLFVKLWQFDSDDRTHVRTHIDLAGEVAAAGRPGVHVTPLFADGVETVRAERWEANAEIALALPRGGELLVLGGALTEGGDELAQHDWLRLPPGAMLRAVAGAEGARVWLKLGRHR